MTEAKRIRNGPNRYTKPSIKDEMLVIIESIAKNRRGILHRAGNRQNRNSRRWFDIADACEESCGGFCSSSLLLLFLLLLIPLMRCVVVDSIVTAIVMAMIMKIDNSGEL